jgi:hypothetical protein
VLINIAAASERRGFCKVVHSQEYSLKAHLKVSADVYALA